MVARGIGWSEIIDGERAETSVTSPATTDVEGWKKDKKGAGEEGGETIDREKGAYQPSPSRAWHQ